MHRSYTRRISAIMFKLGPTVKIALLWRRLVRLDGFKADPTGYTCPFVDIRQLRPDRVDADLLRSCGEPRSFIGKTRPLGA